jgi:hypothetical protein
MKFALTYNYGGDEMKNYKSKIITILALLLKKNFRTIGLDEMNSIKLLNRIDTKFLFSRDKFFALIDELQDKYRILEIDGEKIFDYETLYFDTVNLSFYNQHHNKSLNRFKVRYRKYLTSDKCFLEVKFKSNKGKTYKNRIKAHNIKYSFGNKEDVFLQNQLSKKTKIKTYELMPQITTNYKRITLVDYTKQERVTVDFDIIFKKGEKIFSLENMVIVEVKQGKFTKQSPFIKLAKRSRVLKTGFSKYCIGLALVNDGIKKNRFKHRIMNLKRA